MNNTTHTEERLGRVTIERRSVYSTDVYGLTIPGGVFRTNVFDPEDVEGRTPFSDSAVFAATEVTTKHGTTSLGSFVIVHVRSEDGTTHQMTIHGIDITDLATAVEQSRNLDTLS